MTATSMAANASNPDNSGIQVTTFGDNAVTNYHAVSSYAFGRY